ncbi:gliding motility-associated lipoprotein GldH [Spirosomataceae bacterium TFI 002]|nr:gliding motility-associated lipoprotein GldH [Spirosomataceae bacterium TFI 002]
MRIIKNKALLVSVFGFLLASCTEDALYKGYEEIPTAEWKIDDAKSFTFEIKDHRNPVTLNYLVRNAINYPFYNLYLKATLKDSSGNVIQSGMDQLLIFNEKTGKPLGDGMGDLFDQRVAAPKYKDFKFPYSGKYTIELQHNMRPDPLVGLLGVGVELVDLTKKE